MQKIKIERYDNPEAVGYQGYVEPEDRSWILYVELDGTPLFYAHRAADGGVLCEGIGPHNTARGEREEAAALGHCPRCEGAKAGLVAIMSDDGSCFEAEGCLKCGASWWNNPPKASAPAGAATIRHSEFVARAKR